MIKREIYEVQMLLYWILGVMLLHAATTELGHILGWIAIVWGWLTLAGLMVGAKKYVGDDK